MRALRCTRAGDGDFTLALVLQRGSVSNAGPYPSPGPPVVKHTATSVVTIERYIIEQERLFPEATGELSGILYDVALAAKRP